MAAREIGSVGQRSVDGSSVDVSGRANDHTSAAPFRRPLETNGGDGVGELVSVVVSPGDRGPNPPTEDVLFGGVVRFLFLGLLVDATPALDGGPGWG